jgi:hypothetical protein
MRTAVFIGAGAILLLLIACGAGTLTRDRAAHLAQEHVGGTANILAIKTGQLGEFVNANGVPTEPRERRVWAVVVAGSTPGECVLIPSGERCPTRPLSTLVVLDEVSGTVIFTESPADMSLPVWRS